MAIHTKGYTKEAHASERALVAQAFEVSCRDLQNIAAYMASVCQVSSVFVTFIEGEKLVVRASVGSEILEMPLSMAFCGRVEATQKQVFIEDLLLDPQFAQHPMVVGNPHYRFYMGQPLILPDGSLAGTISMLDTKVGQGCELRKQTLELLSKQVELQLTLAIQKLELEQKTLEIAQKEEELRLDETLLEGYSQSTDDLVYILSKDKKIMSYNKVAASAFIKYTNQDTIPPTEVNHFIPHVLLDRFEHGFNSAIKGENLIDEYEYKHGSEATFWRTHYRPFKNKSGETIGVIVNSSEISQFEEKSDSELNGKQMLYLYFDSTEDAICLLDKKSRIIGFNRIFKEGFLRTYHKSINVGSYLTDLVSPDKIAKVNQYIEKAIEQGEVAYELQITNNNLPEYWLIIFRPLKNHYEELIGISLIGKNITERKNSEYLIRKQNERWRYAIEGSNDGIWDWNLNTDEVHLSSRYKEILGYNSEELQDVFESWASNVHPDDYDWVTQSLDDYITGKINKYEAEYRMRHKDGSYRWILDRGRLVDHDHEGKPLRMAGTHTDITERKETEKYLKLISFSLEQSINPVVWITEDATYVDCNHAALKHFGTTKKQLLGKKVYDFDPVYTQKKWPQHWAELKDNKSITLKTTHKTLSGETRIIEVYANYIEYESQALNCAIFKDITEQIAAEETIKSQYFTLKAINESTRNPIFSIDRELRYTSFNQAHAEEMKLLFNAEIEIGKIAIDYLPDVNLRSELIEELKQSLSGIHLEIVKQYGIGSSAKYFRVVHNPITNHTGEVIGVAFQATDITEKRKTEILLQESEARLKNIVENIPGAVFRYVLHENGTDEIIYASRGCFKLWEFPESRLTSDGTLAVWGIIHPEDIQMMVESIKVSAEELSIWYCECRFVMSDGRIKHVKAYGKPFAAENNKVIWDTLMLDETEKYAAEEQLKWNLNLLKLMSSSSPMGFLVIDDHTDEILYFNSRFCELWNISEHEEEIRSGAYSSMALLNLVLPQLSEGSQFKNDCTKELTDKSAIDDEIELINGRILRRHQLRLSSGNAEMIGVFYMFEDITERKKSEQKLLENEQILNEIFNTSPIALMLSTLEEGIIVRANKTLAEMVGFEVEELLGRQTIEFYINSTERQQIVEIAKKEGSLSDHDLTVIDREGNEIRCIISVKLLTINNIEMLFTGFVDIGKRKQAEEQLKKSFELVTDQNKRLLNFSYIVSHNLRSHTGNIKSLVEIIDQSKDEDEKNSMFELLKNATNSLTETIQNLTEVVSIQTNLNIPKELINIHEYSLKILQILNSQINDSEAVIINEIDKELTIEYYPAYMESILLNFISNALKYRQPHRKPKVMLKSHIEDNFAVLEISDNGVGIDLNKYGEKIFGMYKTFHGNKDARGIGLFMTKNQIEALGGRVSVNSQPGKGSTFTIYFKI